MSVIKLPVVKLYGVSNLDIVKYLEQTNILKLPLYLNAQAVHEIIGFYTGFEKQENGSLFIEFEEVDFSYPKTIFRELYEQFPEAFGCMPIGTVANANSEKETQIANISGFIVKCDMTKISKPIPPRPFP